MRYLKAILACIGLAIIFGIIGYAAGLFGPDPSKQSAKNAFRIAFIIAAIFTWRAATKRAKAVPGDLIPGLVERAAQEQKKIETRHSNEASELEYLERRVPELKASLLRVAGSEQRLREFQPFLDGKFRCPRCWIADGVYRNLIQDGPDDSLSVRCEAPGCKVNLTVP